MGRGRDRPRERETMGESTRERPRGRETMGRGRNRPRQVRGHGLSPKSLSLSLRRHEEGDTKGERPWEEAGTDQGK